MRLTFVLIAFAVLLNANSASALRCGTHLVHEGDSRDRVLHMCGEPTDVSQRIEERFAQQALTLNNGPGAATPSTAAPPQAGPQTVVSSSVSVVVESWTFNFGPDRAMQRVVFFDGLVDHVEALGRGYLPETLGVYGRGVQLGETRDRVRATWGEPTETNNRVIERSTFTRLARVTQPNPSGAPNIAQGARVRIVVETWTYNLGPNRFIRRVVFEDGRVVQVETLGPGY